MAGKDHGQDITTSVKLPADQQTSSAATDGSAVELGKNHTSGSLHPSGGSSGSGSGTASLPDGCLLCGRFRILRFIARGGMGEVYEAKDLELGEHVALKTVLPEIAGDDRAMERFKREIYLARKVTASQICRINDLFRHKPASDGPPDQYPREVTFLTMELLQGESLAALIRRKTRLTTKEAFPLVKQMAEGLAVAHRANVIHRDFKSANVMLVPEGDGLRAVLTDFGLARSGESSTSQHSLTGSDDIVGTPAYMAPEQVEGAKVNASADIYALGVVMYEMVTGTWPFVAETRLGTAMKRLSEPPTAPREYVADLDPLWQRTILRALARRPEDRFSKATDVIAALEGATPSDRLPTWTGPTTWSGSQPVAQTRRKIRSYMAAVLAAALLITIASYFGYRHWTKASSAQVIDTRPAVAVIGLQNLSGKKDDAWIATALSEMLSTELSSGDQIRTVSGDEVARAKVELSLPDSEPVTKENIPSIVANLGVPLLVQGSYVLTGPEASRQLRLDLHLLNQNGDDVGSFSEQGTEASLTDLATRAGAQLRQKLGATKVDPEVAAAVRATVPGDPQAARLYSEGLRKLRSFDAMTARDALQSAVKLEDKSPAIHSALAMAWNQLGYDGKAEEEAKKAIDLAKADATLPQEFVFGLEARYDEFSNQWDKATDIYSSLRRFYPRKLDYGLRLASAQTEGGNPDRALETYASLKKEFAPPIGNDPRIFLGEAEANERLGHPEAQDAAAVAAAQHAEELKAKLLQAPALVNECIALDKMGKYDDARKACEAGQAIFSVFGDQMGAAWAVNNIGNVNLDKGDVPDARAAYQKALEVATRVGAKGHMTGALMNIGKTYLVSGDNQHAASYYEQSLALAKEIGDRKQTSQALNSLAAALYSLGNLEESQKRFEESAKVASGLGDDDTQAYALSNIALIQTETGELPEARRNYDEALRIWKKMDAKPSIADCLAGYAELLSLQGDDTGAAKKIADALALAQEVKSNSTLASIWLSQGQIAIDRGQADAAEKPLLQAIPEFHSENDPDSETDARTYLARALLMQNKTAEAGTALRPIASLNSSAKLVQLESQIVRGAWTAKSGQVEAGRKLLREAAQVSKSLGSIRLQLEAQLAEAESGASNSRDLAQQVYKIASSSGYKSLASRAATLRSH